MLKFEKKAGKQRDYNFFLPKNDPTWVHLGFKKQSNESNLSHNKSNTFIMNLHPKKLFPEIDNYELLNHQVVTKRDLLNFGNALLREIQAGKSVPEQPAQWLKSSEVRKLLKISPGTLQNLRINETLNFNRIGGTLYYKYEDLKKLMEK